MLKKQSWKFIFSQIELESLRKYKSISTMTIPFEKFVVSPHEYISILKKFLI